MAVSHFEEDALQPLPLDGMIVPLIVLNDSSELPNTEVEVGKQSYRYDRSYNIKGHSAVMPRYLRELFATGKQPLVIERPTRYYVYVSA